MEQVRLKSWLGSERCLMFKSDDWNLVLGTHLKARCYDPYLCSQHSYSEREVERGESAWSSWAVNWSMQHRGRNIREALHLCGRWQPTLQILLPLHAHTCVCTHCAERAKTFPNEASIGNICGPKRKLLWCRGSKGTDAWTPRKVWEQRRSKRQLLQGTSSHRMIVQRLKHITAHHHPLNVFLSVSFILKRMKECMCACTERQI